MAWQEYVFLVVQEITIGAWWGGKSSLCVIPLVKDFELDCMGKW